MVREDLLMGFWDFGDGIMGHEDDSIRYKVPHKELGELATLRWNSNTKYYNNKEGENDMITTQRNKIDCIHICKEYEVDA